MPHFPADADPKLWHRFFAIDCNNRAWDLTTQPQSAARDEEMLNAAHASALHWQVAGTEQNVMRAKMLLAEVHSLLGLGRSAMTYAEAVCGYFLNRETPDWEIAFTHTIHAHAAAAAGDREVHRAAYADAQEALVAIVSEEERNIVRRTFELVPRP